LSLASTLFLVPELSYNWRAFEKASKKGESLCQKEFSAQMRSAKVDRREIKIKEGKKQDISNQ